jgi:SM-20-related protein
MMDQISREKWIASEIRGDLRLWLDPRQSHEYGAGIAELTALFATLQQDLNRVLRECVASQQVRCQDYWFLRFKVQVAVYNGQEARYHRHLDAVAGSNQTSRRKITAIYYANADWKPQDGGCLKLFLLDGEQKLIEPVANRLVVFSSPLLFHEVLPSHHFRAAVTCWFCT